MLAARRAAGGHPRTPVSVKIHRKTVGAPVKIHRKTVGASVKVHKKTVGSMHIIAQKCVCTLLRKNVYSFIIIRLSSYCKAIQLL